MHDRLIVLAIDTALAACQVAVARGPELLAARSEPMERGHQERLAPLVALALAEAGAAPADVQRLGAVVGPGSFTGLRVGMAFAKGFALGLGLSPVGVGTLEALAAEGSGRRAAVIGAPHGRVYLQVFDDAQPLTSPALLSLAEAADLCRRMKVGALVGPGAPLLADVLAEIPAALCLDARPAPDVAALARRIAAQPEPFPPFAPLYLRGADAKTTAERAAEKALAVSATATVTASP